ncbi:hypothetical protein TNCV_1171391 [Trichonephila clavipes]|nr:hypothetical protein TNCV_1171391 [Trichonephila clavipes]
MESVPEPDQIGNLIEEIVYFARQRNLEVDREDVHELLDSYDQDGLIEIQEQDKEELVLKPSSLRRSNDVIPITELLDSHSQELTIDEFIEMHEQEQHNEELVLRPSSVRKSNDGWEFDKRPQFD